MHKAIQKTTSTPEQYINWNYSSILNMKAKDF